MTSKEFAKLIGVSQSTVSRAMNDSDLVPEEKRRFIQQKAREYRFVLNSHAKSLRTLHTHTIGILFPKHFVSMSANMMLSHVYDYLQKEMHKYDYDIMVIYYKAEDDDFSSFERIIRTHKVDGFLVLRMELSPEEVDLLGEYQIPCVFLLNASVNIRPDLNYLFSDSEYGGYEAGRYLGRFPEYRKLFLTAREETHDSARRLAGYRRGLLSAGQTLADEDILRCSLSIESAHRCILENRSRFDGQKAAVFTYNDMLGIGVVNACREMGCAVPEQVQVISMDDIPLAGMIHPCLSTIHVDVEEMVSRGCKLLMELIHGEESFVQEWLKPWLILRETTR
ncbi:MAG: LacI family transcriptional regulator [Lachnospiraceae bacterium]|jgi:DNA-binding LacI/PurR family transcriptional regulator|nr:LacI family transcriptional regulator [Lachnospiraceae bacterium]